MLSLFLKIGVSIVFTIGFVGLCASHVPSGRWVFLVVRPNPTLHFAPFWSTHFFPCLKPHVQKWVISVRRRPCVCDTFRFESRASPEKRSILAPLPRGLRQLTFPNVKNDAGQKQYSPCFWASPAEGRRPASQEHGFMPAFGVSAERPAEGPKVGVYGVLGPPGLAHDSLRTPNVHIPGP